jgi:hypothetical protein
MATTTNFGWATPDDTDFVKDGAAAIRTLGSSIDTSLVDLKGGATGQVLSKTSATDMDFTWVTTDDANAIQNSIVDAKGDLISATANDTPARLAVGANGETLVADSSTSTGLRYQSAYNGNGVINGGMDIWQRGTSFALTGAGTAYTADRWLGRHLGTNVTYSQQASGLTGIQYNLRIQRPNGVSGTNDITVYYNMETADSYRFAGQTVTLSYWARVGSNFSATSSIFNAAIFSGTGTNQNITTGSFTGQATVANEAKTATTSWQRFTTTGTVSSNVTQLALLFFYSPQGTAGANDFLEITGIQLEVGSVATSFKRSGSGGGTIQGELAACQRYYQRYNFPTATGGGTNVGTAVSTTIFDTLIIPPVAFRVKPTAIDSLTLSMYYPPAAGQYNTGAFTIASFSTSNHIDIRYTHGTAVFTAGVGGYLTSSGNDGYLGLTAEL